jgi:ADP-heptose:LPS heptosyltransferase
MGIDIMQFAGSLLKNGDIITSSWDIEHSNSSTPSLSKLHSPYIKNYETLSFSINCSKVNELCIINGMGVTLGDSINGISALHEIKRRNPKICITLIRPELCSLDVNTLYTLATKIIDNIIYMPVAINSLPRDSYIIDAGNQLYRSSFSTLEMHDFFLQHIGINPNTVPDDIKCNIWLKDISLPEKDVTSTDYVLLNTGSNAKLREIPQSIVSDLIDIISSTHKLPVYGFCDIKHKNYKNIAQHSKNIVDYIKIISKAQHLYTSDSSALHIAAGFDIPTTCFFNSIQPSLRSRYYKNTTSIYMGCDESLQLHRTDRKDIINIIRRNYERYIKNIKDNDIYDFAEYHKQFC